jgi:hypothetical protein
VAAVDRTASFNSTLTSNGFSSRPKLKSQKLFQSSIEPKQGEIKPNRQQLTTPQEWKPSVAMDSANETRRVHKLAEEKVVREQNTFTTSQLCPLHKIPARAETGYKMSITEVSDKYYPDVIRKVDTVNLPGGPLCREERGGPRWTFEEQEQQEDEEEPGGHLRPVWCGGSVGA